MESEIDNTIDHIESLQIQEENNETQNLLANLESPFTWKLEDKVDYKVDIVEVLNHIRDKVEHLVWRGDTRHNLHEFRRFTLHILLSYLLFINKEPEESRKILREASNILKNQEIEEYKEPLFANIKNVLWHVVLACKVNGLVKTKTDADITEIISEIPPAASFTNVELAGLEGIKASMCISLVFNLLGLEAAKKATELDPKEAEWFSLFGISLRNISIFQNKMEYDDVIAAFEKVVKLRGSALDYITLAQSYRQYASRISEVNQCNRNVWKEDAKQQITILYNKSLAIFKSTITKYKDWSYVLSYCATILLKFPKTLNTGELAKYCVLRALSLEPDCVFNHSIAGKMYKTQPPKDLKRALYHYERASEFGAYFETLACIRLRLQIDTSYDPYKDLMKAVERFTLVTYQNYLQCELTFYFLLLKRDILTAIQHCSKVINNYNYKEKVNKYSLKQHLTSTKIYFIGRNGPINLIKIVTDEARLSLKNTCSLTEENKTVLRRFIEDVSLHFSEVTEGEPVPNQVEKILKDLGFGGNEEIRNKQGTNFTMKYENFPNIPSCSNEEQGSWRNRDENQLKMESHDSSWKSGCSSPYFRNFRGQNDNNLKLKDQDSLKYKTRYQRNVKEEKNWRDKN